jgi:5'-methylthioadenosine phosphorylase
VTVEMILDYLHRNAVNAQQIIRHSIRRLRQTPRSCKCATALRHAILTQRDLIPTATRRKLAAILDPVLGGDA